MNYIPTIKSFNSPIRVIDVGCHKAHWIQVFRQFLGRYDVYSLGVDPCDYSVGHEYNTYIRTAIDNIDGQETQTFNMYPEPGCNSLLDMRREDITHDTTLKKEKWYVGWDVESYENKVEVPVTSLESVLDKIPEFSNGPISFVKIDAQGKDMDVVKSLRKYLCNTIFIQIESVSSHNPELTMYKGQKIMEDDIEEMKKLGFEVFSIDDYSANASPEADVVFYNTKLLRF